MKNNICICDKYRQFEKPNLSYLLEQILFLSVIWSKCKKKDEKIFKEEESIEMLKILGLINNIEKYQEIYNHARRKHESRI